MRRNVLLWLSILVLAGSASGGASTEPTRNLTCAAATTEVDRCDAAHERSEACDYARIIASRCAAGNLQGLAAAGPAAPIEHGTGFRAPGNRSCWRATVGGQPMSGNGNLAVDPWAVAGIPGGGTGELPCGRPEVEAAYEARYVAGCIGPNSPLGGWCSGISNENRLRAKAATEWACENSPEMIGSTGRAGGWDCQATGRDITDFGAFGNWPMLLAIEAKINPPGCVLPKICALPCPTCPVCPLPTCIPPQVRNTACACESWTLVGWRKARCRAACDWATTLPPCGHQ